MNKGAERPETRRGSAAGGSAGVTHAVVEAQLDRILKSALFANAERRSLLLRFLVERGLEGRSDALKEHEIGRVVFGRPASYDPRVDPIVRVQVSSLRSKLREYYAGDGKDAPLLIEFPRGYVPQFQRRSVLEIPQNSRPEIQPIRRTQAPLRQRGAAKTVAVLPFLDLSSGNDQEYFCDGVTEEIINTLAQVSQVGVVARTSAFLFKGKNVDVRQVGAQLNVQAVLEGSIRKEEDRLRVVARLTSVDTGFVLWSATYDEKMRDVIAVQERIAEALVSALEVRFCRSRRRRLSRRSYKTNVELYDLYLLGRYYLNKQTEEGLKKSASVFEQVIARDGSYAPAFSGLADSYLQLGLSDLVAPKDVMPKASAAAKKALELDDGLAEAYTSLGSVQALHDWEWTKVRKTFQRAIRFNPCYAPAHQWYALFSLSPTGSLPEAIEELQEAIRLDPLSLVLHTDLAALSYLARRPDEAIAQCRRPIDLDPSFFRSYWVLGLAYAQKGSYAEAFRNFEKARELAGDTTYVAQILSGLAHVNALSGERDQARQYIRELESLASREYISPFWIAMAHVSLNQREEVFSGLDKACEVRDPWLFIFPNLPVAAPLESDPRYRSLLHRMSLA
jgi:serine/threonine-protein kinase